MGGKFNQVYTAISASFGSLTMGMINVWPSYTSSLYASENTPLSRPMTKAEDSLLGSLPSLGAMVGTAITGVLINKLGRRKGGIILSLFSLVSWVMIELTTSPNVVLAARFFIGVSGGGFLVFAPIFISEVAEDSIRGTLASVPILSYGSGALISYTLGWKLTYPVIVWCQLLASIMSTGVMIFVVESPVYWIRQKKDNEARQSIAKYRGLSASSMDVHDEVSRLKQQILPAVELISITADPESKEAEAEKEKLNTENVTPEKQQRVSTLKLLFLSSTSLRAFLVVITVMSTQVFMGMVPVQVYAKTVFTQTDPARSDFYTVLFALTLVVGALVTALVADKAGRRVLLITSSILVGSCLVTLGYLLQSKTAPSWIIVFMILFYCFAFNFGAGAVPYVLLAEVFIPEVQNLASMIIIEWVWFLNFFILGLFPFLNGIIGIHGVFYTFAVVAFCNAIIGYFIVPETKGLSNQQIQDLFLRKN
ncbi:facilitated trehalose transporter Tret1 isoform X2 [Manduca sexta]|uniref:facilitated trehalose transporter Tret1 isoform X2 n=1 Tax=Manduca sexta TaxID=7130 RepID=UPI00188E2EFB|nr:facilitated trehalose transporter Tret1 isoform X2 [Manduca sexta]